MVAGGAACGALAVGLAVLFGSWAAEEGAEVGPTAATLDEASLQYLGAAVGLAAGSAAVSFAVRRRSRLSAGALASAIGYVVVVLLVFALTAPSDVSTGEVLSAAALLALLLAPAVLLGAFAGAGVRAGRHRRAG